MNTTFAIGKLFREPQIKFKWQKAEPVWSSLPQHKKEEKFMDVLTNGYPNSPYFDDENHSFKIGETVEQSIQRKILAETPIEKIIRTKKNKNKWYNTFRKDYTNV